MPDAIGDLQRRGVKPELRRLHSPDLLDMRASKPANPAEFCILVQAMIGPKGEPGEESFDMTVCTPRWLEAYLADGKVLFGLHYLFVDQYDYEWIWGAIAQLCDRISGPSWNNVAEQLSKYGRWELEGYQER